MSNAEVANAGNSKENLEKKLNDSKAEIEKLREDSASKIEEIKAKLSKELEHVEENISQLSKEKKESIHDLEQKKLELKDITDPEEFCQERHHILKELAIAEKDIVTKTISITALDQTISKLDEQIAKIQARHDKAIAQLEIKRRTLNERLQYFNTLNEKLAEIARLLDEENAKYNEDYNELMRRRSELLKRTDLSETTLNRMLAELDEEIYDLNKKHEIFVKEANYQISDLALEPMIKGVQHDQQYLTLKQLRELREFERQKRTKMTKEERLALLRMGLQITPSGRIITKDDRVITLAEARRLGMLCYLYSDTCGEEEEEEDYYEPPYEFLIPEKEVFYGRSSSRSSSFESSESSSDQFLSGQDIDYLKRVFGKSLSLALAEITAVQPFDPIHYLAHWLIKYRYNQEIDEVRRVEIQELMIERERLEAEKWARELREEAHLAVLEVLYRAENIIMQREYELERLAMLASEYEGEFEIDMHAVNPLDM